MPKASPSSAGPPPPLTDEEHLALGRVVTRDFSNSRVVDRLLMYERRIETSMFRTIAQLRQFQRRRDTEQTRTETQQSRHGSPPVQRHDSDVKKRSQFCVAMGAAGARTLSLVRCDAGRHREQWRCGIEG